MDTYVGTWITIMNMIGYLPMNIDAMPKFMATMFCMTDCLMHFITENFENEVL